MASVTYRCHRKLANGSYEVVHSETESGVVVRPNEETVEQTLKKTLRMKNAEDTVPGFHATIDADTLQGKTLDELVAMLTPDLSNIDAATLGGKTIDDIMDGITEATIPDGKYGYKIVVQDDNGDPIPNVVISGITDISSELKTDSDGICKFNSDSASYSVTLDADGYAFDMRAMTTDTISGYINKLTKIVVSPDPSKYHAYELTITDTSGAAITAGSVYDFDGNKIGAMSTNGKCTVYSPSESVDVVIINNLMYYSATLNNTQTASTIKSTGTIETPVYSGTLANGNTVSFLNHDWLVVKKTSTIAVLAHSDIVTKLSYNSSTTTQYKGSNLATYTSNYASRFTGALKTLISLYVDDTTVDGVTSKFFVPTADQVDGTSGGFGYFTSVARRVCNYGSSACSWWLSTYVNGTSCKLVYTTGAISTGHPSDENGYRPFLTLKLT